MLDCALSTGEKPPAGPLNLSKRSEKRMSPYTAWMTVNIARYFAVVGVFFVAYLFANAHLENGWLIFVGVVLALFGGHDLKHGPEKCPVCGTSLKSEDIIKEE